MPRQAGDCLDTPATVTLRVARYSTDILASRLGFPTLCTPGLPLVPFVSRWRGREEASRQASTDIPARDAAVTVHPRRQRLRMARLTPGLGGLRSDTGAGPGRGKGGGEASSVASMVDAARPLGKGSDIPAARFEKSGHSREARRALMRLPVWQKPPEACIVASCHGTQLLVTFLLRSTEQTAYTCITSRPSGPMGNSSKDPVRVPGGGRFTQNARGSLSPLD
ncbi:hypothetical protein LX36DRAFT_384395 [Colletotrichum falcatum]|nr:hypothetical protein LX36DRAFT_384395 [Colletotrichum falcatum]